MSGSEERPGSGDHDRVDFRRSMFHGPAQGAGTQLNFFGISRVPAELPHQVGLIPPRAGFFQDRVEAARLRQTLASGGSAIVGSAGEVVLAGMGGVGKTQLAANYARTVWQAGELDVLVWITASSAAKAKSGYAQAGRELLGAEPEQAAQSFLARLEPRPHQGPWQWLIVLDDVADPADLSGLWPPTSPYGRVLVTTRRKDAALTHGGRRLIEVGLFSEHESLDYLITALAARDRTEPARHLIALADDLGHLPLALSQAAAYLIDAEISCAAYRDLLADRARTLADTSPDTLPDGQSHSVSAVWAASIDRANSLRPTGIAKPLLEVAAFLDPNGIPDTVLTSPPVLAHLATVSSYHEVTPDQAWRALRALYRLSLIDHIPATPPQAIRIHQLIQRNVRDTLSPHQHHKVVRTAADALFVAWPALERDTALAQALRTNTTALTTHAQDALRPVEAFDVLYRAGSSLGMTGQVTAARDYFLHLTRTTTSQLGPDHAYTLVSRHDLAFWRGKAGDPAGAVNAYTDLLDDRVRVLGPDHHHTLSTRRELARWQGAAGDAATAATSFAELLDDFLRVLGPDHPDTLNVRHDLALWRGTAENDADAATSFAELLDDFRRVLGPDHPDTFTTRHNLVSWQGMAGDVAGAATSFAELVKDELRVLGPDHPYTLLARHNLAHWQGAAGDPAGAATALCELLDDLLRVLGPDHPDIPTTRERIVYWRGKAEPPREP